MPPKRLKKISSILLISSLALIFAGAIIFSLFTLVLGLYSIGQDWTFTGASWAPDGDQLAFYATGSCCAKDELYLVNADGSDFRQIALLPSDRGDLFLIKWSEDGNKIYLATLPIEHSDYYEVDTKTGAFTSISVDDMPCIPPSSYRFTPANLDKDDCVVSNTSKNDLVVITHRAYKSMDELVLEVLDLSTGKNVFEIDKREYLQAKTGHKPLSSDAPRKYGSYVAGSGALIFFLAISARISVLLNKRLSRE